MNEFKQAAKDAAEEIFNGSWCGYDDEVIDIIAKHFTPLAEQHKLLVELAKACRKEQEAIDRSDWVLHGQCLLKQSKIINNPLIAELLKEETK